MEKKTSSREEEDCGSGQQIIIIMFFERENVFYMYDMSSLEPVEFLCIIPLNMFIFLSISGMF